MKDILIRALKTFIQGFLGALAISLSTADLSNLEVVKSLLIGAVAGGVSALMNLIINLLKKSTGELGFAEDGKGDDFNE